MTAPLDLVHLRSLVAIADAGSFSRAAAALHISQPTVSQHVRLLEKRLGFPLVERDGRGMRFTQDGERALQAARRILTVHDDALAALVDGARAALVIGSTETAAELVLPHLLSRVRAEFSDFDVQFAIDRSTQLVDAVARGDVDVALILAFPGDVAGRQLGSLALAWWGADEELARAGSVPLVAYAPPCGIRSRALSRLAEAGREVHVAAESTSIEGVIAAARAGVGVAALPVGTGAPAGLVPVAGLPDLDRIGAYLVARRGVDAGIVARAGDALEPFFAVLPSPA
ncbi:MAG: LysR family transcriptional regulator [Demequina sp.]|uniref:LysR family transcriptional regulator n=1 Tax=Demequina sp. TaxID=2050685 RepID=UPI003A884FBD